MIGDARGEKRGAGAPRPPLKLLLGRTDGKTASRKTGTALELREGAEDHGTDRRHLVEVAQEFDLDLVLLQDVVLRGESDLDLAAGRIAVRRFVPHRPDLPFRPEPFDCFEIPAGVMGAPVSILVVELGGRALAPIRTEGDEILHVRSAMKTPA